MIGYLLIIAAGVCLILWLILGARRPRSAVLPPGEIVYSGIVPKDRRVLRAPKYHLTGAPDYVVKQGNSFVPVEVKSGRVPKELYDSDRMQVISAALLVEAEFGTRPVVGYVQYPGKTFTVKMGQKSVTKLLGAIRTMRQAKQTGITPDVPPSWFYCPTCPRVECPRRIKSKVT